MKKIGLLILMATLSQGIFLFAQRNTQTYNQSEYYYFSFPIEKIYVHRLGYMIVYRKNSNHLARTFVPTEWFQEVAGVGELIYLGPGKEWPSMVVYYHNGNFSHVRIRVRRSRAHETWGIIPANVDADAYFRDLEEVKLEF